MTDTDLCADLREFCEHGVVGVEFGPIRTKAGIAADRLESQAAEIERLREHLRLDRRIADSNARRSAHFERHAAALAEALDGMLRHSCVADSAPEDKFAEDHDAERRARAALGAYRADTKKGAS